VRELSFRRGFKADANRIALRVRAQMGLSEIAPIDPAAVCEHFEIKLLRLSDIDPDSPFLGAANSSFSAVTVPCGWQTAIVHNDSHHLHRQGSNICHELAHCFLGHKCTPPLTAKGERIRDGGIEAEANHLAGALLIPNEVAIYIVREGLVPQARILYGVSGAMLTYRLRISGAHRIHERKLENIRRAAGAAG
jgi:Zn-dependent peptidase ImmA (M78 family)